ncbi:hypothetical protein GCM10010121_092170 [Streptomyces brasiliensis]|uniref:HTH arsR-type domain-containing protein n=1 Tax=Streptomyces brasiliensis TaxID=1954 RepID=A0A917P8T6_9ACTN|nr:hypothetical protein GCM10010121_092170 [Streptomyces brasiliensis]
MSVPLYEAKADFFRILGHPVRIRVLELLQDGPKPVRDLLAAIEIEPSNLSQQLAVLRRSGIVTATRTGSTVMYELAGADVAELLAAARRVRPRGHRPSPRCQWGPMPCGKPGKRSPSTSPRPVSPPGRPSQTRCCWSSVSWSRTCCGTPHTRL